MKIKKIHKDKRRTISLLTGLIDEDKEFTIIHLNKNKAIGGCVHQNREFVCVISGSVLSTIGNVHEYLIEGDSRVIQPKRPHMFVAKENSILIEWGVPESDKGEHNEEMRREVDSINEKSEDK